MKNKRQIYLQIALLAGALVFANLVSAGFFFRIDLTKEKRYSLSDITIQSLDSLKTPMTVRVYLGDEDLPADVKRFADAVRTLLLEMKVYAGTNLNFKFMDPSKNEQLQAELMEKGVRPYPIRKQDGLQSTEKLIFPSAVVAYDGKEKVIDLMRGAYFGQNGQPDFARAEQQLEYKFISTIRRMFDFQPRLLGLLTGHGELKRQEIKEFYAELIKYYNVREVSLKNGEALPSSRNYLPDSIQKKLPEGKDGYDVLLVLRPDSAFTEREKYELDQYVMRGGRVLWVLDKMHIDNVALSTNGMATNQVVNLNMDDLFMKYGFSVSNEIIQDAACYNIFFTDYAEGRPKMQSVKYVYYPYILNFPNHSVTKELDAVLLRYAAAIDTLAVPGVKKDVLLQTSPYSRKVKGQIIDLNKELREPPPIQAFQGPDRGNYITGLALEGNFRSVFENRSAPTDAFAPNPPTAKFLPASGVPGKMFVFSDGDMPVPHRFRPDLNTVPQGNKTLLMNTVDYLVGDKSLTEVRAKDVKIRQLDPNVYKPKELMIQVLNVGAPVFLILLFGLGRGLWRKRKNEATAVKE